MDYNINLEGLSPMQHKIATLLWKCQTDDEVNNFIHTLPTAKLKRDAHTLKLVLIMECIDQDQSTSNDLSYAKSVLNRFMLNGNL